MTSRKHVSRSPVAVSRYVTVWLGLLLLINGLAAFFCFWGAKEGSDMYFSETYLVLLIGGIILAGAVFCIVTLTGKRWGLPGLFATTAIVCGVEIFFDEMLFTFVLLPGTLVLLLLLYIEGKFGRKATASPASWYVILWLDVLILAYGVLALFCFAFAGGGSFPFSRAPSPFLWWVGAACTVNVIFCIVVMARIKWGVWGVVVSSVLGGVVELVFSETPGLLVLLPGVFVLFLLLYIENRRKSRRDQHDATAPRTVR